MKDEDPKAFGPSIFNAKQLRHGREPGTLKDKLGAVLELPRIEGADGTSSLGKGVICFADVDAVKEIEDIQAEFEPLLFTQRDTTGEAEVH